jgi:hypothetical protein
MDSTKDYHVKYARFRKIKATCGKQVQKINMYTNASMTYILPFIYMYIYIYIYIYRERERERERERLREKEHVSNTGTV